MAVNGDILIARLAQVYSIEDGQGGDRIKAKLYPEDATKNNNDLFYAFPLMPKVFFVKPKVGELVLIFNAVANNGNSQRYYIGPVISQKNHIVIEDNIFEAKSLLLGNRLEPGRNIEKDSDVIGSFQNDDDVCVEGRGNTELQLKKNESRLKCGVRLFDPKNPRKVSFNVKSPSYVSLKYYENEAKNTQSVGSGGIESTATVVADKINLIGNIGKNANGKKDNFNTRNVKYNAGKIDDVLIDDDEMNKIIENAHRLPFGDVLCEVLSKMIDIFNRHTHPYSMLPPTSYIEEMTMLKNKYIDNEELLSDNVRIN